ncbi:diacylglycerol kinase family protein [Cystobacter fuscus]
MNSETHPDAALRASPERLSVDEGPAILLLNPNSRMGGEALSATLAALEARGIRLTASHEVQDHEEMEQLLHAAVAGGVRRILVGGGDGTLNCAIKPLLGQDVTLGVLPLGTGNDFARSLGIEPTLEAACDVIAAGYTARVDVGLANGHPFLNAVSLGRPRPSPGGSPPSSSAAWASSPTPWPPPPSSGSTNPSASAW